MSTMDTLKAAVAEATAALEQANDEHERIKEQYRQSLVSGTKFNRARLAGANEAVLAARDRLDIAVMELESARQETIQKSAGATVRALNVRIKKILDHHPLEETV